MDVAAVHAEPAPEKALDPRRVEDGSRADDALRRKPGKRKRVPGENVHGIRNDKQDSFAVDARELLQNAAQYLAVAPEKRLARFARPLVRACRQNDEAAVREVLVFPGIHPAGTPERRPVRNVGGFALGLLLVRVEQHHLGKQSAHRKCVGARRPDASGPDDAAPAHISHKNHSPFRRVSPFSAWKIRRSVVSYNIVL